MIEAPIVTSAFNLCLLTTAEEYQQLSENRLDLEAVRIGQLVAVGKHIELKDIQSFEELGNDLEWISKRAIEHDQRIKAVSEQATVLPFKLGSFFSSIQLLRDKIQPYHDQLLEQLRKLGGKEEWSVKLYGDLDKINLSALKVSAEIEALEQELENASMGKAFLLRKKLNKLQEQHRNRHIESKLNEFCNLLKSCCLEVKVKDNLSSKITNKSEEMLLNTAVLIDKKRVEGLKQQLPALEMQLKDWNIELAVSGPWPPYHFTQNPMEA